jgi:8-oxo-dGTP pyrophosphatase MutT (NUDIX family)
MSSHSRQGSANPRDAATVVIVRDAAPPRRGIEVLLLRRADSSDHSGGAWVFPGGLVDAGDRLPCELALELSDTEASSRLGFPQGGLAFYLAAIRECFEEAGILFAMDAEGEFAVLDSHGASETTAIRRDVRQGKCTLADLCRQFSLRLVPERLHYIAHWLTPLGRAKRFDTRFFVAIAPPLQAAMHDSTETMDHVWIAPSDALSPSNARHLMVPTRVLLETVLQFQNTAHLAHWAAISRDIKRVQPRLALGAMGLETIRSDHPAYEEVGKLDPEGRCDASCELRPGTPVRLSEHIVRTTDDHGRHTYRVGSDVQGWEEVVPSTARPVAVDRIVIARDRACVPPGLLAEADWLAACEGFLQPLTAKETLNKP